MLSALVVVGVPSAVALAGFLCHREGREQGYREGWEDGNKFTPLTVSQGVIVEDGEL